MAKIEEETVEVRRYIGLIVEYWWLMLILPIAGGAIGYLYSSSQTPVYEAQATLLVQQRGPDFAVPGVSDYRVSGELAATYARLVEATPFLDTVIEQSELPLSRDQLKSMVSSGTGKSPPTVEIIVTNSDPGLARDAADLMAVGFIEFMVVQRLAEIARIQAAAAAQGLPNVQDLVSAQYTVIDSLSLLEPVTLPRSPVVPKTRRNIALGIIMGAILAISGALFFTTLKDTVGGPDELRRRFGVAALGEIFEWSTRQIEKDELVVLTEPSSGFAESFRQVRTNIQFKIATQPGKIYLVTSPGPGEGKSTIISNIALSFAQSGKRVILVDGDLRRPSLHRRFKSVNREPGLSNFLGKQATDISGVIHATEVEGVSLIPGGPIPPNPSELLGSQLMSDLLDQVKEKADIVLVDSPPVLAVADGRILAAQSDGVLMIVDGLRTRSAALRAAMNALLDTQVTVFGVITNKLKRARFGYSYEYPHYNHNYSNNYGTEDFYEARVNGTGPIYKRPVDWVRSILSRFQKPTSGN